jgi:hypothetical protein
MNITSVAKALMPNFLIRDLTVLDEVKYVTNKSQAGDLFGFFIVLSP